MARTRKRDLLYLFLIITGIAGALIFIFQKDQLLYDLFFQLQEFNGIANKFRETILSYGVLAPLIFVAIQVLQVVLAPIPGEASGVLGGYLFGSWPGFAYSTVGLTLGSWIAFGIGRLFDDLIRTKLHETKIYHRFDHLVSKGGFIIPFILFLFPGFPKDSLSYLLGLSTMPLPVFLFLTTVGRMPGTLMLSIQGADVFQGNYLRLAVLLLISVLVAVPFYIYHDQILKFLARFQRKKEKIQPPDDRGANGNRPR